ncbi:MAG TPA: Flp family type IVb pilin [Gammaproteobacteria bacterium]|jgi:Flp pilus assembly pilin Flp
MIRKNTLLSKSRQKGASMIEYALVLAAVVAIAIYFFGSDGESGEIGTAITDKADSIAEKLK